MSGENTVNIYNNFGRAAGCGAAGILGHCGGGDTACTATTPPTCGATTPTPNVHCDDHSSCGDATSPCDHAAANDCACEACDHYHQHNHYHEDCDSCHEYHEYGHEYACEHESTECASKRNNYTFGKRLIIASGDLTNDNAPWDSVEDDCEVGLARKLFRASMEARGLYEDCDYQFVSASYNDLVEASGTAGSLIRSGHVDAFLGKAPTADLRNNFLFGMPFHDNDGSDFGVGLTVNKKSPCAKKLIHSFNAGLKRIIDNGTYANCILKDGANDSVGTAFNHWCEYPTRESHPDLFAVLDFENHCHKKSADSSDCKFDHTLLIAAGDQTGSGPAPWHDFVDGVDGGLARKIFRAVMATKHFKEECDFQFVTPTNSQVMSGNLPGVALTSGFVDAALTWGPNKLDSNSVLFGVPMHDDETNGTFGFGLLINKKSPCAVQLQKAWNAGLAQIICNGQYACLVEECGDDSFTAWEVPPTSLTHEDLFKLIIYRDCNDDYCQDSPAHHHEACAPCGDQSEVDTCQ